MRLTVEIDGATREEILDALYAVGSQATAEGAWAGEGSARSRGGATRFRFRWELIKDAYVPLQPEPGQPVTFEPFEAEGGPTEP